MITHQEEEKLFPFPFEDDYENTHKDNEQDGSCDSCSIIDFPNGDMWKFCPINKTTYCFSRDLDFNEVLDEVDGTTRDYIQQIADFYGQI